MSTDSSMHIRYKHIPLAFRFRSIWLIEQHRVRIFVVHLLDMPQNVFFRDHAE